MASETAAKMLPPHVPRCWWLYLLACKDGRTYAGIALDVEARFRAHQSGKGSKFTRANQPTAILGMRSFASKSEALRAEHALKQLSRTAKLAWAACSPATVAQARANRSADICGRSLSE